MEFVKLLLLTLLISSASFAGIDEMQNRDAGMPPSQDVPGNGNGGGNPNVPIDDFLLPFGLIVVILGVYYVSKKKSTNQPLICTKQNT